MIGYGFIQAAVPEILRAFGGRETVDGAAARLWAFVLLAVPVGLAGALRLGVSPGLALIVGLAVFAVIFAINSAMHSYLVLAYTDEDSVALDVGFYYMANAGGRLLARCSPASCSSLPDLRVAFGDPLRLVLAAALLSLGLPARTRRIARSC